MFEHHSISFPHLDIFMKLFLHVLHLKAEFRNFLPVVEALKQRSLINLCFAGVRYEKLDHLTDYSNCRQDLAIGISREIQLARKE